IVACTACTPTGSTDGEPSSAESDPASEPKPASEPAPERAEPTSAPTAVPAPTVAPAPTAAPAPTPAVRDPWEVRVESGDVEVRELVPHDRSYEHGGRTLSWIVEGLVADDTTLWLAEQAGSRGGSGLHLEQPGARITRWRWDGGEPEVLNTQPLHEINLFATFGGDIVFGDYNVFAGVTKLVRLPRAGGEFQTVASFAEYEHMVVSSDGKRIELPNSEQAVDPRTGKVVALGQRTVATEPDLSGCEGFDPEIKRNDVRVFDGHAVWVAIDEVKVDFFQVSRGADGRLLHCFLADGSMHTLSKLGSRWLNGEYAWSGAKLVFALDGGVYAVELPGGAVRSP